MGRSEYESLKPYALPMHNNLCYFQCFILYFKINIYFFNFYLVLLPSYLYRGWLRFFTRIKKKIGRSGLSSKLINNNICVIKYSVIYWTKVDFASTQYFNIMKDQEILIGVRQQPSSSCTPRNIKFEKIWIECQKTLNGRD